MFTLTQAKQLLLNKFGGLYTESPPNSLPPGASPQTWDVDFIIAAVGTRPGLSNPVTVFVPPLTDFPVEYIQSTNLLGPTNMTLAEDAGVTLYEENLLNPGVFSRLYGPILNLARATSENVNQREYIALSDFLQGTDQPRQYDATNLDRISQVGPGQAPSTTVTSPTYAIDTITEIYSPVDIDSISWGASINLYHAQPASTNLYFLSVVGATHFTDNLEIGVYVYVTVGNILMEGIDPGGTYQVTFIGGYSDSDGSRQVFGVTARVSNSDFVRGSAGIQWQRSDALIQLLAPIPLENAVVGGTITIQGSSVPQWNRTWKIFQTPTEGQLSITATALTSNIATYDYVLQSGIAPGWQATFDYPMAAQIVDPNAGDGTVWQITTPGKSGGSIPGFAGSTQSDGTAVWTKQAATTQVLVTVFNTNNGNGIFNIQDQQILRADETSFTVAITSPDIGASAEDGGAASGSGSALIINPGTLTVGTEDNPIYGDSTGGNVLVPNPLVSPGKRWVVCMFLTRNGFITPASPPRPFYTTIETGTLQWSNIPIGPGDVIARIIAITLAEAGPGGPYFWIPDDVIVADSPSFLGVSHTFQKTILEDNTSTTLGSATPGSPSDSDSIALSDAVLAASENISVVGNNLQQERELGECVKVVQYAGRCFYLGERVKNDQFVNLTFDGGAVDLDGTPGMPAGWNVTSGMRSHVSLITSQIFGKSLQITGASGNLVIGLKSVSPFSFTWAATIPLSSMTATLQEFIVPFGNPLFSPVPDDLRLQVYPSNLGPTDYLDQSAFTTDGLMAPIIQPHTAYSVRVTASVSGSTLVIDRMEVFPTIQPVYTLQVAASYADNTEAIDGLTGAIDTSILSSQPETNHFIFLNKYFITTRSKTFSPIQSGSGEPDTWSVDEISNAVGCLGPLADDVGEEYTIVADDNGVYVFDGGNHMKISQEIQQIWDYIYKPSKKNVWVLNDLKQQRILVGVPLPTPNQWLPDAEENLTPATPNVILACSYLGLMNGAQIAEGHAVFPSAFTGNLLFHDGKRKWTIWQIAAATAAWINRPNGGEEIWFGGNFDPCCIGGVPTITSIEPPSVSAGDGDFIMTIHGTNFRDDSVVYLGASPQDTDFISSIELTAAISAVEIVSPGEVDIIVLNPTPGCGASSPVEFDVISTPSEEAGLRFAIDESGWVNTSGGEYQFRVQEAGSDNLYRMFLSVSNGDFPDAPVSSPPPVFRFSPDATKLSILWGFSSSEEQPVLNMVKVFDLGTTLASSGPWGDVDGNPQPDVFILDAPLINQATISISDLNGSGGWIDVACNDNGDLFALENDETPDVVREEMTWAYIQKLDPSGLPSGETIIQVFADPRASGTTSTGTITVRKCCGSGGCGSGDLTVTSTPGVAWWTPSASPVTASCAPVSPDPTFCFELGGQNQPIECSTLSEAVLSFTIMVDRTGLPNGGHEDAGVFDFGSGHECYGALCLSVAGNNGEESAAPCGTLADLSTVAPVSITLSIHIPVVQSQRIRTQPVGGALTIQSFLDGSTSVITNTDGTITGMADFANSLIVNWWIDAAANTQQIAVAVDMTQIGGLPYASFDVVNSVPRVTIYQPPTDQSLGIASFANLTSYAAVGASDLTPSDRFLYAILRDGAEFSVYQFTNSYDSMNPNLIVNFGSGGHWHQQMVFKDSTSGYDIGNFMDFTVLKFTTSSEELTVEDLPGTLLITPSATNPATIRALGPYDDTYTPSGDFFPNTRAIGFGGTEPADQ